ncbi:MAG: hypothetical protein AB7G11_17340 [Phycisphaerales bacterium]
MRSRPKSSASSSTTDNGGHHDAAGVPGDGADSTDVRGAGQPGGAKSVLPCGSFPLIDRRLGLDRRGVSDGPARGETGLEQRRGPGRRRSDFMKAADEGEMTREQFMFLMAIDAFKKSNSKMYPTWSDVLEVIRLMGYRKTMPSELNLRHAEDWREPANAPANVKTIDGQREAA